MKRSVLFSFGCKVMIATINLLFILSYGVTAQNSSYNLNSIPITGTNNSAFGLNTLLSNTTGNYNTALGINALRSNTTGIANTGLGALTLFSNTTGNFNFALGQGSLYYNTSGYSNSAIGTNALQNNVNGYYNIAIGDASLNLNVSGHSNVGIGLFGLGSITGSNNVGIGEYALWSNSNGNFNTAIGVKAGYGNIGHSSDNNTYIGYYTAQGIITGGANTIIGANVSGLPAGLSNTVILADGNGNQRLYIDNNGYAGFGTTSPTARVEVNSNVSNVAGLRFTQLSSSSITPPANGKTLTVDAAGNVILVTAAAGGGGDWSLTGNAGTVDGTNFIGTTDYVPFNIRVNNQRGGRIDPVYFNTFYGYYSGNSISTGSQNTGAGFQALQLNTTGASNAAFGSAAMITNTTGTNNTAAGYGALASNVTGSNNTALGSNANVNANNYSNTTMLGRGASGTASDQVRVGNNTVNSIGGYANWTNISDKRIKRNIKANVPGLDFINKLNPVTYHLDLEASDRIIQLPKPVDNNGKIIQLSDEELIARKQKEQILYTGFLAQDVEKAAKELNYDFSGVDAPKNDKDLYGLRYAEFVVPLVKAVQELSSENDELKTQLNALTKRITALELAQQESSKVISSQSEIINDAAQLEQNTPNPFTYNTVIRYNIPPNTNSAQIVVTDLSGTTLKTISLNNKGLGQVVITAGTLASGNYIYSLIIDGKKVDSKRMVLTK